MLKNKNISIIGAGNMAEALVSGLLKGQIVQPSQIFVTDVDSERLAFFKSHYQVHVGLNNSEAMNWSNIGILAVKPQVINEVLDGLKLTSNSERIIISLVAGVTITRVQTGLATKARIIRAMPNTPTIVLAGSTALASGPGVSVDQLELAKAIFEAVGNVVVLEEVHLDAVTGLSGGGPAYVYMFIEALTDGGVKMGLPRPVAKLLAVQTVLGSAQMIIETGEHPGVLKDRVASPGGTTIAGLHRLEEGQLRGTVISAVESATHRSRELGDQATEKPLVSRGIRTRRRQSLRTHRSKRR